MINGSGKYTWADGRDYTGLFRDGIAVLSDGTEGAEGESGESAEGAES